MTKSTNNCGPGFKSLDGSPTAVASFKSSGDMVAENSRVWLMGHQLEDAAQLRREAHKEPFS